MDPRLPAEGGTGEERLAVHCSQKITLYGLVILPLLLQNEESLHLFLIRMSIATHIQGTSSKSWSQAKIPSHRIKASFKLNSRVKRRRNQRLERMD